MKKLTIRIVFAVMIILFVISSSACNNESNNQTSTAGSTNNTTTNNTTTNNTEESTNSITRTAEITTEHSTTSHKTKINEANNFTRTTVKATTKVPTTTKAIPKTTTQPVIREFSLPPSPKRITWDNIIDNYLTCYYWDYDNRSDYETEVYINQYLDYKKSDFTKIIDYIEKNFNSFNFNGNQAEFENYIEVNVFNDKELTDDTLNKFLDENSIIQRLSFNVDKDQQAVNKIDFYFSCINTDEINGFHLCYTPEAYREQNSDGFVLYPLIRY